MDSSIPSLPLQQATHACFYNDGGDEFINSGKEKTVRIIWAVMQSLPCSNSCMHLLRVKPF